MMDSVKNSVKSFYNAQAEKFSWTRKKKWPEFFYIKQEVEKIISEKWKIKILELWCGDGRLYRYLIDFFSEEQIEYTGVDISEGLIKIAKENWKLINENLDKEVKCSFVVSDMLSFLEEQEQQIYDFVIAVASFQHIPKKYERLLILKNIYRTLNYDGVVQMFNWSFSHWFFKKYFKHILKSFVLWFVTIFTKPLNDIYIPWKNDGKVYYRYYHIFFLFELKKLFKQSWFVVNDLCYINREGNKSISRKDARNSILVARKTVLK